MGNRTGLADLLKRWMIPVRSVSVKWMGLSYSLTKPKLYAILVHLNRKIWNSNRQNSQNAKERKKRTFPGLQLNGLTIISLTRNWKQNSASMAGNSYRMPFPKNIISYLQRWKWKNITLVYMPAKQMNIWSRQTIRRSCCTEVWYPHLWQLQSSTENM